MVERKRLVLVFQRTMREASSMRRLDVPMRARGWNVGNNFLAVRRRDGGGLAIDGAEDVVDGLRSIVERHDDGWLG